MSAKDDEIRNQLSVTELRQAVEQLSAELTALLEGKSLADGRYVHHVFCSADRRQPAGTRDIGCTCKVVSFEAYKRVRAQLAAMTAERDALQGKAVIAHDWIGRSFKEYETEMKAMLAKLAESEKRVKALQVVSSQTFEFFQRTDKECEAAIAEATRLREAVMWALGYSNFQARGDNDGPYWWRPELRRRAFPDGLTEEEILLYQRKVWPS